jgi:HlyD family secretion protein
VKRILGGALIAAVVASVGWAMLRDRGGDTGDAVPTYLVREEMLVRRVRAEGNLRAVKATPLTVPRTSGDWGGMKVAWLAPDGSHVAQGDVVVRFDRTEPEKQLADGEADLASANARLAAEQIKGQTAVAARDSAAALARSELEQRRRFGATDEKIYSRNQIIEHQIDDKLAQAKQDHGERTRTIERDLSRSKASVIVVEQQAARIAIEHARTALDSMEVRAPHAGIFVLQRNWRGEVPKLGDQLWPGQTFGEIPLLEAMEAEVFVLEVDGSGLAERQQVELVIESRPETVYRGHVRLVDKLAKPRIGNVPIQYFAVVVELDRTDPAVMKPGQRVRATLVLDETRALVVPRQAITNKDGKTFVHRRTGTGSFEHVAVELGPATSGRVVVKAGLTAGDAIALRDPTRSVDHALGSAEPGPDKAGE